MFEWYDAVGTVGVVLIVGAYLLLQLGRLRADAMLYSALNALGALLIIVSLVYDFNMSAFLIEAFWLAISVFGLKRSLLGPRADNQSIGRDVR
jgi:hypothetical protein